MAPYMIQPDLYVGVGNVQCFEAPIADYLLKTFID